MVGRGRGMKEVMPWKGEADDNNAEQSTTLRLGMRAVAWGCRSAEVHFGVAEVFAAAPRLGCWNRQLPAYCTPHSIGEVDSGGQ